MRPINTKLVASHAISLDHSMRKMYTVPLSPFPALIPGFGAGTLPTYPPNSLVKVDGLIDPTNGVTVVSTFQRAQTAHYPNAETPNRMPLGDDDVTRRASKK